MRKEKSKCLTHYFLELIFFQVQGLQGGTSFSVVVEHDSTRTQSGCIITDTKETNTRFHEPVKIFPVIDVSSENNHLRDHVIKIYLKETLTSEKLTTKFSLNISPYLSSKREARAVCIPFKRNIALFMRLFSSSLDDELSATIFSKKDQNIIVQDHLLSSESIEMKREKCGLLTNITEEERTVTGTEIIRLSEEYHNKLEKYLKKHDIKRGGEKQSLDNQEIVEKPNAVSDRNTKKSGDLREILNVFKNTEGQSHKTDTSEKKRNILPKDRNKSENNKHCILKNPLPLPSRSEMQSESVGPSNHITSFKTVPCLPRTAQNMKVVKQQLNTSKQDGTSTVFKNIECETRKLHEKSDQFEARLDSISGKLGSVLKGQRRDDSDWSKASGRSKRDDSASRFGSNQNDLNFDHLAKEISLLKAAVALQQAENENIRQDLKLNRSSKK